MRKEDITLEDRRRVINKIFKAMPDDLKVKFKKMMYHYTHLSIVKAETSLLEINHDIDKLVKDKNVDKASAGAALLMRDIVVGNVPDMMAFLDCKVFNDYKAEYSCLFDDEDINNGIGCDVDETVKAV